MKRGNVAIFIPHLGCAHACSFCNQHLITGQAGQVPRPEEIRRTLDQAVRLHGDGTRSLEIAFFGGSFTAVERDTMCACLETVFPYVGSGQFQGVRISTRPDCVDAEVLKLLAQYGVTAVELGAQSMSDGVLALNRRGHTALDVAQAAALVRRAGFELGLQMMTGLYGDTPEGAQETAASLIALKPDTVRIYPTVVLAGTYLARLLDEGRYAPPALEDTVALCARLLLRFDAADIPVIRLGLHSSELVEAQYLAGPYHPALRDLAENHIFLEQMRRAVRDLPRGPGWASVHPKAVSRCVGQNRHNLITLERMGYRFRLKPDDSLSAYELRMTHGTENTGNAGVQILSR
ncbi:MAG: radical SAM protein [Clostridiales bacterium]|nr:radical SAM protein [Clostridiales bacterium]